MAKPFSELFKKYEPSDSDKNVISKIVEYSAKADKESRIIICDVVFDGYVPIGSLFSIENAIAKAYELSRMEIHPSFKGVSFDVCYIEHVFIELSRRSASSNGFFSGAFIEKLDGSEVSEDNDTLYISLRNGGKNLLVSGGADALISDIIEEMFGERKKIEFCGITELTYDDLAGIDSLPDIHIPVPEEVKEAEIARAASATLSSALKTESGDAEIDIDEGIVRCGGMIFDISEIENVYNTVKDIDIIPLRKVTLDSGNFTVCGEVFGYEKKLTKKQDKCIVSFYIGDKESAHVVKMFYSKEKDEEYGKISDGKCIIMQGKAQVDKFDGTPCLNPTSIGFIKKKQKTDTAEEKRVELHLHTMLSTMDSVFSCSDVIKTAVRYGHKAIAITDHGNVQAFPEILAAKRKQKADIKVLYGIESYFVDDTAKAVFGEGDGDFKNDKFCVFDIETTGLSAKDCKITEIGAVLYQNGEVLDTFSSFVNPHESLTEQISNLTGITDDMLKDAPD
ncbi:MAG: PHP domain-containing protein, partial [Clostridia bacterium]|nr:PHP domain-containing protein [Clostridia bacterium]